MKQFITCLSLVAAIAAPVSIVSAQGPSGFHIAKTFHIASPGGWDYVSVNFTSNQLYVSHGAQVNILDKSTGDSIGFVPNTAGVHGIAYNNAMGRGYTSNGRSNNVSVFDLKTQALLTQITTGTNPDAIMYDEFSKKVITCNGRSNDLSVIDPSTDKVVATIPVGGKPETAVSDNAGKIFVNIEDKNEIIAIDIKTNTVLGHWALTPGESPTGLAIDTKTKRLFAGCDKQLIVMDATNGNVVAKLPIGDGCDGVSFDPTLKLVFTSNGSGTMTVIKESSASDFSVVENVPTKRGARTICVDEKTHRVYLLAADYEAQAAGATGRPRMIPGSFQVLMLEK